MFIPSALLSVLALTDSLRPAPGPRRLSAMQQLLADHELLVSVVMVVVVVALAAAAVWTIFR
ncbi:hypothetical protein C5613_17650 [Rhodococcus opacus]|uniref:Uncharacterized protein n=1 Tax=Rhodococcus opacus TaxID=37919 RepID=A0A2S8J996_RHOOP|nr:hypothetical protein C5613_17650 [Rhodococcus opacus]